MRKPDEHLNHTELRWDCPWCQEAFEDARGGEQE